jgi:hypothetical protein
MTRGLLLMSVVVALSLPVAARVCEHKCAAYYAAGTHACTGDDEVVECTNPWTQEKTPLTCKNCAVYLEPNELRQDCTPLLVNKPNHCCVGGYVASKACMRPKCEVGGTQENPTYTCVARSTQCTGMELSFMTSFCTQCLPSNECDENPFD